MYFIFIMYLIISGGLNASHVQYEIHNLYNLYRVHILCIYIIYKKYPLCTSYLLCIS